MKNTRKIAALITLTLFVLPLLAFGQIPDKFTNLQVLPKETNRQELIQHMRSFAMGLGVRCHYCHVGQGDDFSTFDFASDDKPAKKTARVMMQMRDDINKQYLAMLGEGHGLEVNCVTCHHGQPEPKSIEQVMTETIEKEGIDAGIEKYRKLREEFYGGFTFDFKEMPLNSVASQLARSGKADEAVALLNLNLEFHPNSFFTYFSLGETLARMGDTETAIKSLKKAYEINPNPRLEKRIEELSKK